MMKIMKNNLLILMKNFLTSKQFLVIEKHGKIFVIQVQKNQLHIKKLFIFKKKMKKFKLKKKNKIFIYLFKQNID